MGRESETAAQEEQSKSRPRKQTIVAYLREINGAPGSARLGVIYAEKEFDKTLAMSPTRQQ
jgi:hypothetical protein